MLKIFIFIDIWFVKKDIQIWLKTKTCSFYGEFENEKKKGQIFFDLPKRGFESQIFSNFPTHDLNFHVKWGASKQASKRDRTLQGFPVLCGFRTWEKQLIVEIVLEIYLVLRLRAEDDVLCFEFWLRLTLGVLEKLGEAAALSRLRLTDVRVSCRYPGL